VYVAVVTVPVAVAVLVLIITVKEAGGLVFPMHDARTFHVPASMGVMVSEKVDVAEVTTLLPKLDPSGRVYVNVTYTPTNDGDTVP